MEGTVYTLEKADGICILELLILQLNHNIFFPLISYQRSKRIEILREFAFTFKLSTHIVMRNSNH
jgi:hypothetical protein